MREKIISGILWSTFQLFLSKAVSYLVVLLLAYLLLPEDFGMLAMATVFTGLIMSLGNTAITSSLIQFKTSAPLVDLYQSARTLVFFLNALIWLIYSILIAPLAVYFYNQPILNTLIPILALQGLIGAFNIIPRAKLSRELRFKPMAVAESVAAMIAGLITIILAFLGFGLWALVAQTLLIEACQAPLLRRFASDDGLFRFSPKRLGDIAKFTGFDSLTRSFLYLTKNIDYLLVGKLLGAQLLGAYAFAFMATDILRAQIMNVLNRVMFPVYSQLQDKPILIKNYYLKVVRFNIAILCPLMLFFLLFADDWISQLLGSKWSEAIFPMQAMAIAGIIHAFGGTTDSVLKAIGKVDLVFKIQFWQTFCVTIPAFAFGTTYFGITGAALAVVLNKLTTRILYQYYMHKFINVASGELFSAAQPAFFGFTAAVAANYSLNFFIDSDMFPQLFFQTVVVLVLSAIIPIYMVRREFAGLLREIRL